MVKVLKNPPPKELRSDIYLGFIKHNKSFQEVIKRFHVYRNKFNRFYNKPWFKFLRNVIGFIVFIKGFISLL
jgi:catalase (peroxidase I)